MDYMDLDSEFPEEHTASVPEDTWEYEEETLPDREEEETLWIDADLPGETAGEEWAADAETDASDASAPGANRMRIAGSGLPGAQEPSRWGGQLRRVWQVSVRMSFVCRVGQVLQSLWPFVRRACQVITSNN
ncbi:MAG: hypothetical protein LUF85_15420 [Bacteroides sp.]|nr:hypothetical protein [Bacteroides sp.]